MKVERVMKRDVHCIPRRSSVAEAARLMRDHGVGFLPVIGADFRVCGAVTDRDLVVRALADGRTGDVRVEEVMSHDVIAVRPDDLVSEAERKMAQWQKSRIMVLDEDGLCCGVLSWSDLTRDPDAVNAAGRKSHRPTRTTALSSVSGRGPWRHTDANFSQPRRRA